MVMRGRKGVKNRNQGEHVNINRQAHTQERGLAQTMIMCSILTC